jgi:hypothetical protein
MEHAPKYALNSTEIGLMSWIALMFLSLALRQYTYWELRSCLAIAVLPIAVAQALLLKLPLRKMAIRALVVIAAIYFGYWLLNLVWR